MGLVKLDLVVFMTNRVKKYKEQAVAELCPGQMHELSLGRLSGLWIVSVVSCLSYGRPGWVSQSVMDPGGGINPPPPTRSKII